MKLLQKKTKAVMKAFGKGDDAGSNLLDLNLVSKQVRPVSQTLIQLNYRFSISSRSLFHAGKLRPQDGPDIAQGICSGGRYHIYI